MSDRGSDRRVNDRYPIGVGVARTVGGPPVLEMRCEVENMTQGRVFVVGRERGLRCPSSPRQRLSAPCRCRAPVRWFVVCCRSRKY